MVELHQLQPDEAAEQAQEQQGRDDAGDFHATPVSQELDFRIDETQGAHGRVTDGAPRRER